MMKEWSIAAVAALVLAGCASGYNKNNIFGGYWHKDGPGKLVEVGYSGNGYTKAENVEIYLLYRSAELAKARSKPFVSIYPSIAAAIVDAPVTDATASALGGKPFGKVYVVMRDADAAGAMKVDDILAKYAEAVRTGDAKKAGGAP